MVSPIRARRRQVPAVEVLEPRILYTADPAGISAGLAGAPSLPASDAPSAWVAATDPSTSAASAATQAAPRELAIVDLRIPDAARLVTELDAQRAAGRPTDLLLVDGDDDGLARLGEALAAGTRYDAVHLFGHGRDGAIDLGAATLDAAALFDRAGEIAAWSQGLSADADLLLWGCDSGAGDAGARLLDGLAALTGADVAASTDATGGLRHGGDWTLEAARGAIEAVAPLGLALQAGFAGVLGVGAPGTGGGEVQVNQTLGSAQSLPADGGRQVATNASGQTVVVWIDANGDDVMMRRFDASGAPLGNELLVNSNSSATSSATVAMNAAGDVVVVWIRESNNHVYGQRFDSAGAAVAGEFRVDAAVNDDGSRPSVAIDDSGRFVVAWLRANGVDGLDVVAQRFDADGTAAGGLLSVAAVNGGDQIDPAVAIRADGSFAVAFAGPSSGDDAVMLRSFDATGAAESGSEVAVSSISNDDPRRVDLAVDADGRYVVVWDQNDGSDRGVWGRVMNHSGSAHTAALRLDEVSGRDALRPSVATLAGGGFVVAWETDGASDGSGWAVRARLFAADGTADGASQRLNDHTTGDQRYPSIAIHGRTLAAAWSGTSATDADGVVLRTLDAAVPGFDVVRTGTQVDEAGVTTATFDLRLRAPPTASVRIDLAVSDATEGQLSTTTLTFTTANWATAQRVTVRGVDDSVDDGDVGFTVSGTAVSTDGGYDALALGPLAFTTTDDDAAGLSAAFVGSARTSEAGATARLRVTLTSQPTAPVTITLAPSIAGEVSIGTPTLNFDASNWNTAQEVLLTGLDDQVDDGDRTLTVTLTATSVDPGYDGRSAGTSLENVDDDTAAVTVSASGSDVTEAGSTQVVSIALATQPTAPVTVTLSLDVAGQATLSATTLTFTATEWATPQDVTITGVDDPVDDGDTAFRLQAVAVSADGSYAGLAAPVVALVNTDDDSRSTIVVDTLGDTIDGDTSSLAALWRNRGGDGVVSLREAIDAANRGANGTGGVDRIGFDLPGTGAQTITLTAALPTIVDAVEIDGHLDPARTVDGTPVVTLRAGAATGSYDGLRLAAGSAGSTIRGLAIEGMGRAGIEVLTAGNLIEHNHVGTDASGTLDRGNTGDGVRIIGGSGNVVRDNLVSGNAQSGIELRGGTTGNLVENNRLGTNAAGTGTIANGLNGVILYEGARANVIRGNLIGGNAGSGVRIAGGGTDDNTLTGNSIGTNAAGTIALGNGEWGVHIGSGASDNTVGGATGALGNRIGLNGLGGVRVVDSGAASRGNAIVANRIDGHPIGIDLSVAEADAAVVTPNDASDTDAAVSGSGGNALQNFPVLTGAAAASGRAVTVVGTLDSTASTSFRIDVYADSPANGTGHGEARWWLGHFTVTTSAAGTVAFNITVDPATDATASAALPTALAAGTRITATATRLATGGVLAETSEFAANVVLDARPTITTPTAQSTPENAAFAVALAASDADTAANALAWSITGGPDEARFALVGGTLSFLLAPDFEAPADANGDNVYEVDVRVVDGLGGETRRFSVTVTGAPEPPAISNAGAHAVLENTGTGIALTATDPDTVASSLVWSIAGGPDAARFQVVGSTLRFVAPPDFEAPADADADNVYQVDLRVSDGTSTDTRRYDVTVTDVDEPPTVTVPTAVSRTENGTEVATLTATDPETLPGALTWSIVGGADAARFQIVGGVLRFVAAPDFEAPADANGDNVYQVDVQASDGNSSDSERVLVTVTNVDEPPTITTSSAISKPENGTGVASLAATDPDTPAGSLVWTLVGGADAARFALTGNALRFVAAPDFEAPADADADNVYQVQVRVSDGTGSDVRTIAVTVTGVNEPPTVVTAGSHAVPENTTAVTVLSATDPDTPDGSLVWTIAGGADAARFVLTGTTLAFVAAPDFEAPADADGDNVYQVDVRVSDGVGSHQLTLLVSVTGVPEAPTLANATDRSLVENTLAVATLRAADPDTAAGALVYTIVSDAGTDGARFEIVGADALRFRAAPDFESPADADGDNVYTVRVSVSDGTGADTRLLTVRVTDDAGGVVPTTGAMPVNAGTTGSQFLNATGGRAVAFLPGGDLVVVWTDTAGGDARVMAGRFDARGDPIGTAWRVDAGTLAASQPAVAVDAAGRIGIAWTDNEGGSADVRLSVWNADGTPVAGTVTVNTATDGRQWQPAIAAHPAGGWMVSWTQGNGTTADQPVMWRRFGVDGTPVGAPVEASNNGLDTQRAHSAIGVAADGSFVVVYASDADGGAGVGGGWGVYARVFEADGSARTSWQLVDTLVGGPQTQPEVSVAADGRFVVVWTDQPDNASPLNGAGARARLHAADGTPTSGEIALNTVQAGDQHAPTVSMLADGGFVAAWQSSGQDAPGTEGILIRRFAADGSAVTSERIATPHVAGDQVRPSLAVSGTTVALAWSGATAADADGVGLRLFTLSTPGVSLVPVVAGPTGLAFAEAGGSVAFDVVATAEPAAPVVVRFTLPPQAAGRATLSATEFTFDASNWNLPQRLVVTGVANTVIDGDLALRLTATPDSLDAGFAALAPLTVDLVRTDDDSRSRIVVDTVDDSVDGDTTSLSALAANRGADGVVSLREALLAANASANGTGGPDEIAFDLPGTGAQTIRLDSALPGITDAVVIDGTTDPGHAGTPVVVLTPAVANAAFDGLTLDAGSNGSIVRGLAIGGFGADGLHVHSGGNTIEGNHLGVDAAGTAAFGNAGLGLSLHGGASDNLVRDNLIGANRGGGILIEAGDANRVQANVIGTDRSGTIALGNALSGIAITQGASGNLIGGPDAGDGNRIVGNDQRGVHVYGDASTSDNAIVRNTIDGQALGIDLSDRFEPAPFVSYNDDGDVDGDGNRSQNFPVLSFARPGSSNTVTRVDATLSSTPSTTFRVDFYADASPSASGFGEGAQWLGSTLVTTDGKGTVAWTQTLAALPYLTGISATATRTDATGTSLGDTSEFSRTVLVNSSPTHTGSSGLRVVEGTAAIATLTGTDADTGGSGLRWAIVGGDDAAAFTIDAGTGALAFVAAPDFERATDTDANNTYRVDVRLEDPLARGSTRSYTVTVTDRNEAPVVTVPAAIAGAEDTPLRLSAADGTALSVTDPDTTGAALRIELSVDQGRLTLASTQGLLFAAGDGAGDTTMRFAGAPADIAAALASVLYEPASDASGPVTLRLSAVDAGDPALAAAAQVAITIAAINDAPVVSVAADPLGVAAGDTLRIGPGTLRATDADHGPEAIGYLLSQPPAAGALLRDGAPLAAGATFSQADIDAGRIAFAAPADGGLQTLALTVTDAGGATVPVTLRVSVEAAAVGGGGSSGTSATVTTTAPTVAAPVVAADASAGDAGNSSAAAAVAASAPAGAGSRAASAASATVAGGASADNGPQAIGGRVEQFAGAGARGDAGMSFVPTGAATLAAYAQGSAPAAPIEAARRPDAWLLSDAARRTSPGLSPAEIAEATQAWSPVVALRQADFREALAQVREEARASFEARGALVASSVAITTSLSIGYVVWLLRGGVLLTSLLASMPAWRSIDPLPVLARTDARGRDDGEDDSLRGLLARAAERQAAAVDAAQADAEPVDAAARVPA